MSEKSGRASADHGGPESSGTAEVVLGAVDDVMAELHLLRPGGSASLDSRLGRDLGLDSLALAEILVRLEEAFEVALPSALLASAETPRDLLVAVLNGGGRTAVRPTRPRQPRPAPVRVVPTDARTLVEVLDWHCTDHPDRVHLRLLSDEGTEEPVTYGDLRRGGARVAQGLIRAGVGQDQKVALMLPTGRSYFEGFVGVLLAGGVPVPIYPPSRPSQVEEHLRRHAKLLTNADAVALLTDAAARPVARLLRSAAESVRLVTTVDELASGDGDEPLARPEPAATALLQYTSGSTGSPKGVVLSHAHVLANIAAMAKAAEVTSRDVFVSWLPLYHDMGLIGAWLGSLYLGMPAVIMSPLSFLARPLRWLAAISAYGGTMTAAPNFAYELCVRKVSDAEAEGLDLSSLRMAFNGAEPVAAETMERFAERFSRWNLRPGALAPVYGLAECAVGLAFPPPGRGLVVDDVDAEILRRSGKAVPIPAGRPGKARFVSCGRPLPGYEIRVVDDGGRELPERTEGRLGFRGPSATSGYYHNPKATAGLFRDGWIDTGDLGYIAVGDVYITGRAKDLIIRAGRNLHPEELETVVGEIPGVRKGCVAAFASRDPRAGTEKLVVMAETRETSPDRLDAIRAQITAATVDLIGNPADEVVLAPPGTVLKTSSGKIRRAASANLYQQGGVGRPSGPPWWQLVRFAWSGLLPSLRRARRDLVACLFAAYCWVLFAAVGFPTLVMLTALPRLSWRRRLARTAARSLRVLSATRLVVHGAERLPTSEPCVVVSNHQSWLDALVLASWLPAGFVFVAGELFARQRLAGFLLRRIGAEFVERYEPGRAVAEAARLAQKAATEPLVLFPEGELARAPGLRPFHLGAFVAATQAGQPVTPIAIRGTRSMLRPGGRFVRRGSVSLVVSDPIRPVGEGWSSSVDLERRARAAILRHCGEPDLA